VSKLRIVKERTENRNEHETDLRGLAGLGLIETETHWIFGSVANATPEIVRNISQKLNLRIKQSNIKGVTHLYEPGKHHNVKEKAITLAGAILAIAQQEPTVSGFVGEVSLLGLAMKNSLNKQHAEDETLKQSKWKKSQGKILISESTVAWLQHAGINLSSAVNQSNQFTIADVLKAFSSPEKIIETSLSNKKRTG